MNEYLSAWGAQGYILPTIDLGAYNRKRVLPQAGGAASFARTPRSDSILSMHDPEFPPGRIMAIDIGEKRHGVALSDPYRQLARPFGMVKRKSRRKDFARFAGIAAEQNVTQLLFGLPHNEDNAASSRLTWIRDYGQALAELLELPIDYWDESYSSVDADGLLTELGTKGWRQKKKKLDAVAAAIFLQAYLDQNRD